MYQQINPNGTYSGVEYATITAGIQADRAAYGQIIIQDPRGTPPPDEDGNYPVHPDWGTPAFAALIAQTCEDTVHEGKKFRRVYTPTGLTEVPYTTDEMVDTLWWSVHNWMDTAFDSDFRGLCLDLKTNPDSSETRLARIADLSAWSLTVWAEYERLRALYLTGDFSEDFDPSAIAPRPWSCRQIMEV